MGKGHGGIWYGLTRLSTEPFIGKEASKIQAEKNENWMRKSCRETIIPSACAVAAFPAGGVVGSVSAFAGGKAAAEVIYPKDEK